MDIKLLKNHKHWNAKPTKLDGKDATEFHGKWINYLDANDNWQEINTDFVETVDKFEMKNAPFEMYIPLYSDGVATQHINNRWGVGIKQKIKDVPIDITIKAIGVSKVKGIIEIGDLGWGETNYVIYKNAWSNADLIYYIQHGKAPRLRKLVRFNSNPNLTKDTKFSFELGYSDNIESFIWDWDKLPVGLQKHQYRKFNKSEAKQITDRGLSFKLKGSNRRGATFKSLRIWDSKRDTESNDNSELWNGNIWQRVNSEVEHIENGKIILTKIIPKSFFDKEITYPVFTDFASTFHPDQDAEADTVDGYTRYEVPNSDWSVLVAGAGGYSSDTVVSSAMIGMTGHTSSNRFNTIARCPFLFDTSSIPDGDSVSSATLSLKGTSKTDGLSTTPSMNIYSSSPASNTSLAAGDYDSFGTTAFCDTDVTYAGWNTSAFNDFVLNASGIAAIDITGISKFGTRNSEYDVGDELDPGNHDPNWVSNSDTWVMGSFAETEGTASDPKLVVEHSVASTAYTTSVADGLSLGDVLAKTYGTYITQADSVSLSDSIPYTTSFLKTISDSVSLSDSSSFISTFTRTISEALSLSDTISAAIVIPISVTESISLSDTKALVTSFTKTISDTFSLSDAVTTIKGLSATISESVSLSDSATMISIIAITVSESITLVDSIIKGGWSWINKATDTTWNFINKNTP